MPRLGAQCTFQIIMVFICKCSLFCISKLLLIASQFLSCKQHDHTEAKKNNTSYQLVVQESRLLGEFWVSPFRSTHALCQTLGPHETTHATLGDGRWTSDLCLSMCSEEFEWKLPPSAIICTSFSDYPTATFSTVERHLTTTLKFIPISLTIPKLSSTSA